MHPKRAADVKNRDPRLQSCPEFISLANYRICGPSKFTTGQTCFILKYPFLKEQNGVAFILNLNKIARVEFYLVV